LRCENALELTLVDVGQNTTLGDGDVAEKLVQLLIVADGELEVTGDDTGLLVVASGVAGKLEDLSSQVLEDSGEVDGSASTDTLGVVALAEETVDTTNGERETGLGGAAERNDVSMRRWIFGVQDASFRSRKWLDDDVRDAISMMDVVDSRLRVGLGARGLAARLAASHFDGFGWVGFWVGEIGVCWRRWSRMIDGS
jgi:hypothetical protein